MWPQLIKLLMGKVCNYWTGRGGSILTDDDGDDVKPLLATYLQAFKQNSGGCQQDNMTVAIVVVDPTDDRVVKPAARYKPSTLPSASFYHTTVKGWRSVKRVGTR